MFRYQILQVYEGVTLYIIFLVPLSDIRKVYSIGKEYALSREILELW